MRITIAGLPALRAPIRVAVAGLIGNALDFSEVLGINLGELSSKLCGIENVVPWRYDEIISHDLRQRYGFRIS
jgi:hypothetical protein